MESCHMEQALANGSGRHLVDRDQLIRDLNRLAPEQFDAVVNAVIMSQPVNLAEDDLWNYRMKILNKIDEGFDLFKDSHPLIAGAFLGLRKDILEIELSKKSDT